jgi:hypothetical protein
MVDKALAMNVLVFNTGDLQQLEEKAKFCF